MTVQKDVTKNIYVGNGSTRTFPFTFECPAEHPEYIKVYLMQDDGTALATSDYQLDMDARQITYPSSGTALPEGKKLVIMRELPLQQMMNLVNNGPYFAEDIETAFDECVMAMQQIAEKLNRSIIMSVDIDGDAFVNEVPFEAGKSFRIADDGKSIVLTEDPAKVLPLAQGVYAQTQAQAQSAAASAAAAAKSENNAAISASASNNSAQSASTSAASAAESARLAEGYKTAAETAMNNASLYAANADKAATDAASHATNARDFADNADTSKQEAQTAATSASASATNAKGSADNAKTYMDNAKNYSENVNVFTPSVSTSGVLSWTNKAGLANPPSVNIKGEKGDQGLQGIQGVQGVKGDTGAKGDRGATGTAATIRIGTVTTGASGSEAVVTNVGTANDAVFNFRLPRGEKGADGGIEIDAVLSSTSTNPVQNKVIRGEFSSLLLPDGMLTIPSSDSSYVSKLASDSLTLINDMTQTVIEQSADGETWETLFDSDTANETVKKLYKNGLKLSPFIDVAKGKMVRVTLSTHTTLYFASIALGMKIMDESNSVTQNPYKCYAGMHSLNSNPIVVDGIATWGSTPCTTFRRLSFNTVRYIFNEDKKDLSIYFSGIYCKGARPNRSALKYDSDKKRTVTSFPIEAPSFMGNATSATKTTQDGDGNVISTTYAKSSAANTWEEQQDFKEVKLGYEKYLSTKRSTTSSSPAVSLMQYEATGAFTLDLSRLSTGLQINESTVFTAYITSSADYPLTITNAGTIKYIGSASDVAITSAGLLLNILMMKDASDTITSIVQASKLS